MITEQKNYLIKEISGDELTPIRMYQALEGKRKVLFESNAKYVDSGRYSFIAFNPIAELTGDGQSSTYIYKNQPAVVEKVAVIERLKQLMPRKIEGPFSFFGGVIGYFGYETAFHFEQIGDIYNDIYAMPDVHVYFYDTFAVMDHLLERVSIVAVDLFGDRSERQLQEAINNTEQQLLQPVSQQPLKDVKVDFKPTIEKAQFIEMVEKAKEHIVKGDIFQVVLSQTFASDLHDSPFDLYRRLRISNASPYMYYMEFDHYTILGTSPESLVKVKDGIVTTNPIAGTKPRGKTMEQDEAIAQALLQDEKELAEHKMLVDLGRNDVGRVAEIGTVHVTKYMQIERYKHVMHIVSEVQAKLKGSLSVFDVLASSLPAGTVSGAPKIRAMQIINELEKKKRGVYAGAIGYVSVTGDLDLALAIRTMVVKDNRAYVQAGAGVVYDSNPTSEYEETLNKARALLEVKK